MQGGCQAGGEGRVTERETVYEGGEDKGMRGGGREKERKRGRKEAWRMKEPRSGRRGEGGEAARGGNGREEVFCAEWKEGTREDRRQGKGREGWRGLDEGGRGREEGVPMNTNALDS